MEEYIIGQEKVAEFLGVSSRTVKRLKKKDPRFPLPYKKELVGIGNLTGFYKKSDLIEYKKNFKTYSRYNLAGDKICQ